MYTWCSRFVTCFYFCTDQSSRDIRWHPPVLHRSLCSSQCSPGICSVHKHSSSCVCSHALYPPNYPSHTLQFSNFFENLRVIQNRAHRRLLACYPSHLFTTVFSILNLCPFDFKERIGRADEICTHPFSSPFWIHLKRNENFDSDSPACFLQCACTCCQSTWSG